MPSFDIVLKMDVQEVDNAVTQAQKELAQRYDFKGSKSKIEWDKKKEITIIGDDDYKLKAVLDIVQSKLIKRGISIKNLEMGKIEAAFEGTAKQKITLIQGVPVEKAKNINKLIKDSKIKVQSVFQDEQVRVSGKNRDDLQETMQLVKSSNLEMDFQFVNFRD